MALPIWLYISIPVVALFAGAVISTLRVPGAQMRSAIGHFTAGVVFAAAAAEVLPDLLHQNGARPAVEVIVGAAVGVLIMLGIERFAVWMRQRSLGAGVPSGQKIAAGARVAATVNGADTIEPLTLGGEDGAEPPTSLLAVTAVDLVIDGIVLGVGFSVGARAGVLLTIALGLEIFFLGISIGSALARSGMERPRAIVLTTGSGVGFAAGAVAGVTLLAGLSPDVLEVILAAGLVALLYLVTEELLTEAHVVPERAWGTALFFAGFLLIITFDLISPR